MQTSKPLAFLQKIRYFWSRVAENFWIHTNWRAFCM